MRSMLFTYWRKGLAFCWHWWRQKQRFYTIIWSSCGRRGDDDDGYEDAAYDKDAYSWLAVMMSLNVCYRLDDGNPPKKLIHSIPLTDISLLHTLIYITTEENLKAAVRNTCSVCVYMTRFCVWQKIYCLKEIVKKMCLYPSLINTLYGSEDTIKCIYTAEYDVYRCRIYLALNSWYQVLNIWSCTGNIERANPHSAQASENGLPHINTHRHT